MKKILLALLGFYIGLVVFMPKSEIFYKGLEILNSYNINILSKTKENPIKFEIDDAKIFYLKMPSATFKKAEIYPFIFYNVVEVKDFRLNIGDYVIKNLKITYIPGLNAKIEGKSNFGELSGYVNFKELKIYIKNPRNDIKTMLRKDNKGFYYYERF